MMEIKEILLAFAVMVSFTSLLCNYFLLKRIEELEYLKLAVGDIDNQLAVIKDKMHYFELGKAYKEDAQC